MFTRKKAQLEGERLEGRHAFSSHASIPEKTAFASSLPSGKSCGGKKDPEALGHLKAEAEAETRQLRDSFRKGAKSE